MRTAILSVNIGFFFLLCICHLHLEVAAAEPCPRNSCVSPDKCEDLVRDRNIFCPRRGDVCCSIVKSEFRTNCGHHGGACMDDCNVQLQRHAVDCEDGQVCCVLV